MLLVPIKDNFELPTEGPHPATIVAILPGGVGKSQYGKRHRTLLTITYRIEDQQDMDGEPILLDQHLTFVIRPNSALNKLLSRLGILIDFRSPAFDVHSIVGRTINIGVQHITKGLVTFANVADYPETLVPLRRQVATVVNDLLQEGV